jgi:MFS superfamily sulfate permease-like transporter
MNKLQYAYKISLIYGYAVVYLIVSAGKLKGINVFSPNDIESIEVNNKKGDADYGKIISYKLSPFFFFGSADIKKYDIKESETVHICPDMIDNDPRGVSLTQKLFDKLQEKKNIDYSLAQALYKNATPLRILITPPDITEEDFMDAVNKFKDINMKTEFVAPEGFDIKSVETGEIPNPEPFVNYYLQTIASGAGIPYALLISNQSGLANTRVAFRQYLEDLAATRKTVLHPAIENIIKKLQNMKVIGPGEVDVEISEIDVIDPIDKSTMELNTAKAIDALVQDGVINITEARAMLGLPPVNGKESNNNEIL